MAKTISLAQQVELLFKQGHNRGLPTTYRAVAEATGETANNLFRIRHGRNLNPGLHTISALVNYFGTDKTKAGCLNYLKDHSSQAKRVNVRRNRKAKSR